MNDVIHYMKLIACDTNVTKIKVSIGTYTKIIVPSNGIYLVDIVYDYAQLKSGHYCTYCGIEVHVGKNIDDDKFHTFINDKWSPPIEFKYAENINKVMKLKAFW